MPRPLFLQGAAVCAAALVATGCLTDHNELAEQPPGTGGARAVGSGGSKGTRDAGDAGEVPEPDTGTPPPPPSRPRRLTLLHGVIDTPWIAFCLAPVHAGVTASPGRPLPAGGLEYGHSVTLEALPDGDLASDGVLPYVVAARSADAVNGLDCKDLLDRAALVAAPAGADATPPVKDAGAGASTEAGAPPPDASPRVDASIRVDGSVPSADSGLDAADAAVPVPDVRVAALPLLPEGSFAVARGYLMVAGGCLGGPGIADPSEKSVCGEMYTAKTPTLSEVVVAAPADTTEGRVTLSMLGGSPALTQFDVSLVPASHGDSLRVASRVVPGALRPVPPFSAASASDLGVTSSEARVELFAFGGGTPVYNSDWSPTLRASGLADLEDGKAYTLVFVGPFPGFSKRRWWNDPLVTIVANQ